MQFRNVLAAAMVFGCVGSLALAQPGGPASELGPVGPGSGLYNPKGFGGFGPAGVRVRVGGAIVMQPMELDAVPADAQALVTVFDGEAAAIRAKAEQEIQIRRQTLIAGLQALQDAYTRQAKLDEAVAIRDRIRQLKVGHLKVEPNPGNLSAYANRIGETFYFEVTGGVNASIWGTEVYTYDSDLATAAVHTGVLKPGKSGIVKVTMVKSPDAHRGSTQHGVTSSNWGNYSASYTVEPAYRDSVPALKTTP